MMINFILLHFSRKFNILFRNILKSLYYLKICDLFDIFVSDFSKYSILRKLNYYSKYVWLHFWENYETKFTAISSNTMGNKKMSKKKIILVSLIIVILAFPFFYRKGMIFDCIGLHSEDLMDEE